MASSAQNIYVSATIRNTTATPQLSVYQANLTGSVIKNPSFYELSVDRSLMNTGTLPVYRFIEAQPSRKYGPSTDIQSSIVVACAYNGVVIRRNIVYQDVTTLNQGVLQNGLKYGDVFTFTRFVQLYNIAIAECIDELKASHGLALACPNPVLSFSGDSDKFSLLIKDYSTYFVNTLPTPVTIYGDNNIGLHLLKGFDFINTGLTDAEYQFRNDRIVVGDLTLAQDYSTLSAFSPVVSVYVRTSLNITNQYERNEVTGLLSQTAILRDYILFLSDESSSVANSYVFNVVSQREYLTIEQSSPLTSIALQVFWTDAYGFEYPVYQAPNSTSNVKLYFRLRDEYRQVGSIQ